MLVLRNIKRKGNVIEANYYPEASDAKGFMSLSILDGEVINHVWPEGHEFSPSAAHAKKALMKISTLENLPKEKTVTWY